MSTKVVRWMIAILATIIMLIFLAIVGALVEEGQNAGLVDPGHGSFERRADSPSPGGAVWRLKW